MEVKLISSMGDDLQIVNAARVSFGKKSEWDTVEKGVMGTPGFRIEKVLSKADQGLIQFLARGCTSGEWEELSEKFLENTHIVDWVLVEWWDDQKREDLLNHIKKMPDHWTPFGHTAITLHIKAPIFVARQLGKHQVGFVWNEVSRRYITDEPEFYIPETWRKAAVNVKQGSSDETMEVTPEDLEFREACLERYKVSLEKGICPEQARMDLPQSMYTEWYWTGNLYGFANVYNQRTDSHAQKEVRDVAHQIGEIIEPLFPCSWSALTR